MLLNRRHSTIGASACRHYYEIGGSPDEFAQLYQHLALIKTLNILKGIPEDLHAITL